MDTSSSHIRAASQGIAPHPRTVDSRAAARAPVTAQRIVIVGGGAGGLELAVKLARRTRRRDGLTITLVDASPTHFWKPLLHEVATGSMNAHRDETSYAVLGARHGFDFRLGRVLGVDASAHALRVDAIRGADGRELVPARTLRWSRLVLAVGSESRDFGIPGVAEHARYLDCRAQAERLHADFVEGLYRTYGNADEDRALSIVIVGGGATGVELAADLHGVLARLRARGLPSLRADRLRVSVVEAGERLVAALPEAVGKRTREELVKLSVEVRTGTRVTRVGADTIETADGARLPADITVWAAGIRAPGLLVESGLPTDATERVEVDDTLRVRGTLDVFAIGDCAACTDATGARVPPSAQAAHQMANAVARNVLAGCEDRESRRFTYRDRGALVSLGGFRTIGSFANALTGRDRFVEGAAARLAYLTLYRMHQVAVHGPVSALLLALRDRVHRVAHAGLKLHR